MNLTVSPEELRQLLPQGASAVRQPVVDMAIQYAVDCGVAPQDAAKLKHVFDGPAAPALLTTPELWITSLTRHAQGLPQSPGDGDEMDLSQIMLLERLLGKLVIPASQQRTGYQIELREDGPQHLFVIGYRRKGRATQVNGTSQQGTFVSYAIVICETKNKLALVLALDVTNDGDEIGCDFSGRLYRIRRRTTSGVTVEDRLEGIQGRTNLPQAALAAAIAAEFPVFETRKNRQSPDQRFQAAQLLRYGGGAPAPSYGQAAGLNPNGNGAMHTPQLAGVGAGIVPTGDGDPFQEDPLA